MMQPLPRARTPGAIVYLAQKRHSSYGRDSIGLLTRSLRLLFENYNDAYRDDVLVFHEGDFTPSDQASIIDGRAPIRFGRSPYFGSRPGGVESGCSCSRSSFVWN